MTSEVWEVTIVATVCVEADSLEQAKRAAVETMRDGEFTVTSEQARCVHVHGRPMVQPLADPPAGVSWESWLAANNRD